MRPPKHGRPAQGRSPPTQGPSRGPATKPAAADIPPANPLPGVPVGTADDTDGEPVEEGLSARAEIEAEGKRARYERHWKEHRARTERGRRLDRHRATAAATTTTAGEVVEMVGRQVRVRLDGGGELRTPVREAVVVGDRVTLADDIVLAHLPRTTELRRGGKSGVRIVCANADLLVIVASTIEPPFRTGLVDRMLVAAGDAGMDAAIVLNKCDTGMPEEVLERIAYYEAVGYPSFLVSAAQQKGLDTLRAALVGRTSVLAGHSGVGKSSLLRALIPGVVRDAGELDEWGRGRHTTTGAAMFDLPGGGRIIDLPGVREYGVEFILREELRGLFPEMEGLSCKYADCTHNGEDGCVVEDAIDEQRLDSYRKLLEEAS